MRWIEKYKEKLVSAGEAVSAVKSGDKIFSSGNAATPYHILQKLAERRSELQDVAVFHLLLMGDDPLSKPEMQGHFRHKSLFVGPADRKAIQEGRADYFPIFLHEVPRLFRRQVQLDIAIIQTSPPDEHGFVSLGVETAASKAAVETAKLTISQINEKMPRSLGDSFIHISQLDKIVEHTQDLPELATRPSTEIERKIAEHIMPLIEDRATLQLGIGGIPDALLALLGDRKDLGIHSEMVSDGVMQAIESGIVTNACKTLHPGKVIATFILGSRELYQYTHNNPIFEMRQVDYTNDPFVVAQNDGIIAINSALEVDISGQVCSDSIGHSIYSGFGGQVDFVRGAARAKDGKPIIALPATALKGGVSRIVPHLKQGAGVVTCRGDVHYVATEYGLASLHGKSIRERAEAMIQIAHPDFRSDLESFAREIRYL